MVDSSSRNGKEQKPPSLELSEEIIGIVPSWITRRGMLILLSVFLVIIIICSYITYPLTLRTHIKILPTNLTSIRSKQTGTIVNYKQGLVGSKRISTGDTLCFVVDVNNSVIPVLAELDGYYMKSELLRNGMNVEKNKELFRVVEPHCSFFGVINFDFSQISQFSKGQKVNVSLGEFVISGRIVDIEKTFELNLFHAIVDFDLSVNLSDEDKIRFIYSNAEADVLVSERKIIEYLF